jgi:Dolichyl-phosphate-mannose-protein mannosyltransferase
VAAATLRTTREGLGGLRRARLSSGRSATWAKVGFAVLCVGAIVGFFAFPTYPTYDSFYALLWGRDLLHLHLPDFHVYRGPTEHPLAIAFGMLCSIFGQGGARLMVLGSIVSFVAVVVGAYRLGRLCFGPVVGLVAALLVLSRFFVENLSAQGYLDISYVALIVWALVLEVERPRRGMLVFLTLAAAGLLRPDAWVLSGVYWLWCVWPARGQRQAGRGQDEGARAQPQTARGQRRALTHSTRLRYLALAAIAPVVWVLVDGIVTGNPLYSLSSTAGLAQELERTQGFSTVLTSVWTYGVRIDKLPVVLGGLIGVPLAVWLTPRRVGVPLSALVLLVLVYVAEGAVGVSVIDRYLMGAAIVLLLFCAVTVGGWTMLERGSKLRRVWMAGAAALVLYGGYTVATTLSLSSLRTTLAYHEDFHEGLVAALHSPTVKAQLRRCPLLSLPNNKLIPDARWILDSVGQHDIVARSEARADVGKGSHTLEDRILRGSVAVYPLGSAVFFEAIVDVGDDPRDQVPLAGFRRVFTSRYYAVYANC